MGTSEKLHLELFTLAKLWVENRQTLRVKLKIGSNVVAVATSGSTSAQLADKGTECSVCGLLCVLYTAL